MSDTKQAVAERQAMQRAAANPGPPGFPPRSTFRAEVQAEDGIGVKPVPSSENVNVTTRLKVFIFNILDF